MWKQGKTNRGRETLEKAPGLASDETSRVWTGIWVVMSHGRGQIAVVPVGIGYGSSEANAVWWRTVCWELEKSIIKNMMKLERYIGHKTHSSQVQHLFLAEVCF